MTWSFVVRFSHIEPEEGYRETLISEIITFDFSVLKTIRKSSCFFIMCYNTNKRSIE